MLLKTRLPVLGIALCLLATAAQAQSFPAAQGALALLPLGFAIGMMHALEADHLAAVATLFNSSVGRRRALLRGAFWGLGHTFALFVICSAVLLLGVTISQRTEAQLEFVVGAMVLLLGVQVIVRLRRDKVHIHVHDHGDHKHLHFHSHTAATHGQPGAHKHLHRRLSAVGWSNVKALSIGLVHGAAGSAGVLVLMVASLDSYLRAIGYLAAFGLGTIAGMAAVSAIISLPLGLIERGATSLRRATNLAIGVLAITIGSGLMVSKAAEIGLTW